MSKTADMVRAEEGQGQGARLALRWLPALLFLSICLIAAASAQAETGTAAMTPEIGARKILIMLFLMIGPIKILAPFVNMTQDSDPAFRRQLATRAILLAAAVLAVAGFLGTSMLDNFNISVPVLALTAGVILFLVALQTVLQQVAGPGRPRTDQPTGMHLAFSPLAFPTIVTPYGIAAVIVFVALAEEDYMSKLTIAGVVLFILLLDWLAMLFAATILRWLGPALQVFAVVIGVTQIALGLQVIMRSLSLIGVFVERAN